MPEITNDERGRRIFQLHKEKAVEVALEKIRRSPRSGWADLSPHDIATLTFILGVAWVSVERNTWNQCSFSKLTRKDLEKIIRIGDNMEKKSVREETAVNEVSKILKEVV
jgi:hypothetical protein